MSNKDKKKHRHRSRSPSIERHKKKKSEHKRKQSESDDSESDSSSSSEDRRQQKHKSSKKSRDQRSRSRSRDRERRSRSRDRDRHSKSKHKSRDRERGGERYVLDKKKEKELRKALETPEEKRARRLAKKEVKERKRKAQMGWDEEYMGYTNADNPFGDENLLNTFVWGKKLQKEGKKDLGRDDLQKIQRQKMEENRRELEQVKKRRLEREREHEEREREREQEQRDKEAEYFMEWEKQEDTFHLQQAKLRSKIRIDDGRAKPIDILGKYISTEDDDLAVEMHEPYTYLNGLTIEDLEDLLEDIEVYTELEQGKNADYWRDITIITKEELTKLKKIDPNFKDYEGTRRQGINQSVNEDIGGIFKGKSTNQLMLLDHQIRAKLSGGEGVDVGYWESLLEQLKAHLARTRLRERHQEQLRRKLFKLKQEQGIESQPLFPIIKEEGDDDEEDAEEEDQQNAAVAERSGSPQPGTSSSASTSAPGTLMTESQPSTSSLPPGGDLEEPGPSTSSGGGGLIAMASIKEEEDEEGEEDEEEQEAILTEEDLLTMSYDDYTAGSYSPKLIRPSNLDMDTIVFDEEDDWKKLQYSRQQLSKTGRVKTDQETEFEKRAREGMNDDEAQFSVQVDVDHQAFLWADKYRPRKPRFFNRVHTGFEWNKYNQTHYDIDNPPPKIVQGYKFNIFYPDLIDKTETPEYFLTPNDENSDFATLRFHAGPPYEDIAFKIVNREWEYSYKRGFRCQFHNNIFQLWFHFKRYRYRR